MTDNGRHIRLLVGLGAAVLLLLGSIFSIQLLDDRYKQDADRNSTVYETIYPTRGAIFDRNGAVLVGNKVAYDILVSPREVKAFDTLALATALGVTPEFIRGKMDEYHRKRASIGFQAVTMMRMVPAETYLRFEEVKYKFPGFRGQARGVREYPVNAGGNLLGYVSEVNQRYMERHPGEYRSGDYAGMTGIEAAREQDLRGKKGYHIYLRNARNQIEQPFKDGAMDKEAVPGKNIVTTIDAQLQQYGQELMAGKVGSVVALEPSTGEILALVSSPGIDVEQLADIGKHYNEIAQNPYKPMYNRAVQASYPPGSVFKLVNALIGMQEGVLRPEMRYPCSHGYHYGAGHKLGCHGHRSPIDMTESIMMSCNAYYCYVLKNIVDNRKYDSPADGLDHWNEYVKSFGFGRQGEILATPMHLANLCATIANRGHYYIPHIVKASEGVEIDPRFYERQYTLVDTTHFPKVIRGMWMAVNAPAGAGGTARVAHVDSLDICGKTGTAQNPRGADNSVFICFAPKDNPKIALAAYVENGGFGAAYAAPIASLMAEKYLKGKTSRPELEKRMMETNLMDRVKHD